jgi:uncharacterized protein (TIGR03067 family)
MSRTFVLAVAVLAVPALAAPKVKEKAPPAPEIVGEWVAESRTFGGQPIALPVNGTRLIFRPDGTYTFVVNGQDPDPHGHKFTLNAKGDPAEIDFIPREKPAYLGVFKIEKDTLTLCHTRAGDARPDKLESPAGSRADLYVFRRATKN